MPTPPNADRVPPARRLRKSDLPRDGLGRLRELGERDLMAHLRDLPAQVPTVDEALRRGLRLFDEERFFESYVHLALAWKRTRAPAIRGLVQVAGGLCHVQRGNPDGARAVLTKAAVTLAADEASAQEGSEKEGSAEEGSPEEGSAEEGSAEVADVDLAVLLARIRLVLEALDRSEPVAFPRLPRRA